MSVTICYEAGINHQGSIGLAKQLIDIAADAGCTVIKFQKRTVDTVYTTEELAQVRPGPWGQTNGELKHLLEFGPTEYDQIDAWCVARGIQWTASAWDARSVDFIASYEPPFLKIPSALLTHDDLLVSYRDSGVPLVLSTGMSTLEEIDHAVTFFGGRGMADLTLLQCTATYPCRVEEMNLLAIPVLRARYAVPVGFSSHSISPWPILGAVALGATFIEFHGTTDRTLWGSDQSASLEPEIVRKLVREIRDLETAMGTGEKVVYPSEEPIKAKLRKSHV